MQVILYTHTHDTLCSCRWYAMLMQAVCYTHAGNTLCSCRQYAMLTQVIRYAHAGDMLRCNGHYNCTPDLGKCGRWWNTWDLARHSILDAKVLDRNVTWLTKHKDTS